MPSSGQNMNGSSTTDGTGTGMGSSSDQQQGTTGSGTTTNDNSGSTSGSSSGQQNTTTTGQPSGSNTNSSMDSATTTGTSSSMSGGGTFATAPLSGVWRVSELQGKTVYGSDGANIGEINDILISQNGSVNAVIIGVGGFLGMGEKNVAVNTSALQLGTSNKDRITLNVTRDDLKSAPDYKSTSK